MITLTGHGALATAYLRVNPDCYVHSFRSMPEEEIRNVLKNTEVLIHNSAGLKKEDAAENLALTKKIVWLVLSTNKKIRVINIGSMSYLNEHGYLPISRMSPYAYSKFLSETYCIATLPQVKTVRFSTLFYKDPERDALSQLCSHAVKDKRIVLINGGQNKRDYLPIDKAAEELHRAVTTNTEPIMTFASGIETTFIHAAKIIQKRTACKIDFSIGNVLPVLSKFNKTTDVDIEKEIEAYIEQLKK